MKTVYIFNCDWDASKKWLLSRTFPNQKQLTIHLNKNSSKKSVHSAEIKTILDLYPQLTTLGLNKNSCKWDLIKFISSEKEFEELNIDCNYIPLNEKIHFQTLKRFGYGENNKNVTEFTFSFDQLERLTLTLSNNMNIERVDKIIKQNKNLVEVSLKNLEPSTGILESSELHKMKEIGLELSYKCSHKKAFDDIITFVNTKSQASKIIITKYWKCYQKQQQLF